MNRSRKAQIGGTRVARKAAKGGRPFVFLNAALSADGKLAPATRRFQPFSSPRDQRLLYQLRATADAVMCGARTLDRQRIKLGPGGAKYRRLRLRRGLAEYNLRVVVSGAGSIRPQAEIFKHRSSPIIVLTTRRASPARLRRLRRVADEVRICGKGAIDFAAALRWLRKKWGVRRLLCEGGGELNGALFQAGLVDEVHLTLCPAIFGGRTAPTLADFEGASRLAEARRLELASARRCGEELFLCYRVSPVRKAPQRDLERDLEGRGALGLPSARGCSGQARRLSYRKGPMLANVFRA
jgi:2,5-diamino-6-(ribosylamino)-4(3H)-pyrimidinone 5'-phosphate reductase